MPIAIKDHNKHIVSADKSDTFVASYGMFRKPNMDRSLCIHQRKIQMCSFADESIKVRPARAGHLLSSTLTPVKRKEATIRISCRQYF